MSLFIAGIATGFCLTVILLVVALVVACIKFDKINKK